jgi:lysophospholipase L1-like esterase
MPREATALTRAPTRRWLRLLFPLLTLVLALVLLAGLAEIAIRFAVAPERWRFVDATHHWQLDPRLGWVQGANLDSFSIDLLTNQAIPLRTNADGLMPATAVRERAAGVKRVLLVGDSTIVGAAVPEEQRIHNALRQLLAERGLEVEVLNAGTEGFSTDQAMLRLEQLVGPYDPDVVLHCVCANDLVANTLPENYGLNKPWFRLGASGELIAGAFTPSEKIRELGTGPGALVQHSALYRLLRPKIVVLRARMGGWEARNLIGLDNDWYHDEQALERIDWALFGALVARMQAQSGGHGALFAAYLHPDVGATWDPAIEEARKGIGPDQAYDRYALERRVAREVEGHEATFLPMVQRFAEQQQRGPFHLLPRNPHCNGEGYRVQAEVLAEFVAPALTDRTQTAKR